MDEALAELPARNAVSGVSCGLTNGMTATDPTGVPGGVSQPIDTDASVTTAAAAHGQLRPAPRQLVQHVLQALPHVPHLPPSAVILPEASVDRLQPGRPARWHRRQTGRRVEHDGCAATASTCQNGGLSVTASTSMHPNEKISVRTSSRAVPDLFRRHIPDGAFDAACAARSRMPVPLRTA